jgi:hypothetical protein
MSYAVDEYTNEGRIETIFGGKRSKLDRMIRLPNIQWKVGMTNSSI